MTAVVTTPSLRGVTEGTSHSGLDAGQASVTITVKAGATGVGNDHSTVGTGVLAVCLKELRPRKAGNIYRTLA